MPMMLVPLENGEPILLDKAIMLFGRHPDCDVVLTSSRKVSRKHCCIAQIHDYYVVRDLGSMNGVRVNGEPAGREARLRAGDEVHIGDIPYRIEVASPDRRSAKKDVRNGSGDADRGVRRVSPDLLSRDVPVAVPEEGADFIVEETRPKMKRVSSSEKKKRSAPKPPPANDEVIVLGDEDILS
jgi:predicted component of type VI protein secretion system